MGLARRHSCRGPMRSVPSCGSGWVLTWHSLLSRFIDLTLLLLLCFPIGNKSFSTKLAQKFTILQGPGYGNRIMLLELQSEAQFIVLPHAIDYCSWASVLCISSPSYFL